MINPAIVGGAARLKLDPAKVKMIADGNSFFASGSPYVGKIAALPPLNGQFTITNVAIGGQSFRMMNGYDGGSSADVDAAIAAEAGTGKTVVLLACEATNSIFGNNNPRTGEQTVSDAAEYAQARKAYAASVGVKLLIVMCTTIPREISQTDAIVTIFNERLNVFDAALKTNFRSMGVDAVVDVRTGTRFDFVGNSRAVFDTVADILPESIAVHPNAAGYDILAAKWGPVLSRLPVR